jgi:hypothetical protein
LFAAISNSSKSESGIVIRFVLQHGGCTSLTNL